MVDVVDTATRSRMMSGIRGRNTKPEILVRSLLHRQGFRFRLHVGDLPGKPDIVLRRFRATIFVHGCWLYDLNANQWLHNCADVMYIQYIYMKSAFSLYNWADKWH